MTILLILFGAILVSVIVGLRSLLPPLTPENYIAIGGFYFTGCAIFLAFSQLRINLRFNQKKAASDLVFNTIPRDLVPSLRRIVKQAGGKSFLDVMRGPSYLEFSRQARRSKRISEEVRAAVHDVINFYERMGFCIFSGALDEDICYDDSGFLLVEFHRWVRSYVDETQEGPGGARIFSNFVFLADQWGKRLAGEERLKARKRTKLLDFVIKDRELRNP